MLNIKLLLLLTFVLSQNIHMVNSIVCYQCTGCPVPFTTNYPYVTLVNNTNFLAQCTTTIVDLGDGSHLISKGSVFYCPAPTTSGDVQIYCCGTDYCNTSHHLGPSLFLLLSFIFIRIYI